MLDKLITVILEVWQKLLCFYIVDEYDRGVLLRLGRAKFNIEPGFHWKIPFADNPLITTVVATTLDLKPQTLMTKDGVEVTVRGVVKFEISDVRKFLLDVYDQNDAIGDTSQGVIARLVMDSTFQEIKGTDINNQIAIKARVEGKKYGIHILQVTLTDITKSRAFRIYNEAGLYN